MNSNINVREQLELGFAIKPQVCHARPRPTRIERAAWWFGKMRAAVDNAITWRATPTPPPQQIWFAQAPHQAAT